MVISTRKTWLYPLVATLMAVFVALGIALASAPARAFADDLTAAVQTQADNNVTVALTIVDEQDNKVVCNKKITGLTTENTVADMLAKAGYTQVDEWAGDEMTYVESWGYPGFLGKAYDGTTGMYWVDLFNCAMDMVGDTALTSNLQDAGHYQYIYTAPDPVTFEASFEYTGAIPDPLGIVQVALTIVDEQDNMIVYNGKVDGLMAGDTVADMLAKAGYTQVDEWAGDEMTYVESWGYPGFLGKAYDGTTGMYWVDLFNCAMDMVGDTALTSNLQDAGHYQYIYTAPDPVTFEASFEYTGAIPDPLTTETPEAVQLIDNLTKRFGKNGKDGSLSNYTYGAALGLGYLGKGKLVDTDSLKAEADKVEGAGTLAKYVMALSAAGDTEAAGLYLDKIDKTLETTSGFYDLVLILPAYDAVGMEPSGEKYTKKGLIEAILAQQAESGLFPQSYSGVQETGEALFALAPYADDATVAGVSDALAKARTAIVDQMDPNTGIILPNPMWSSATMDVDAMGEAIDGLIAFEMAKNGEVSAETLKLADALANGADSSLDGYVNVGTFDETTSSAAALRGLGAAFAHGWKAQALDYATIADFTAMTYTGSALEPACTVKMGETVLQKGIDYAVDYNNNVNVGTATAVISGIGKYYGSVEKTFTINAAAISSASIAKIANKKYTGKNIEPAITMKLGDKKLVKDTDYAVSYKNNKKVGKATVTITGKGNLTGTAKTTFKIAAVSITKAKISKIANKKYTGKNIKPKPVVKFNGKKLKKGTDYKVSYKNNKKVGKATVIIKGKGNFKGTAKKTFKIVKK